MTNVTTTKLEAVRDILADLGLEDVATLTDTPDAQRLDRLIDTAATKLQTRKWHWNTEVDAYIPPVAPGWIYLPNSVIAADPVDTTKDAAIVDGRLYDKENQTYDWGSGNLLSDAFDFTTGNWTLGTNTTATAQSDVRDPDNKGNPTELAVTTSSVLSAEQALSAALAAGTEYEVSLFLRTFDRSEALEFRLGVLANDAIFQLDKLASNVDPFLLDAINSGTAGDGVTGKFAHRAELLLLDAVADNANSGSAGPQWFLLRFRITGDATVFASPIWKIYSAQSLANTSVYIWGASIAPVTSGPKLELHHSLPYDDLPEIARRWVVSKAARKHNLAVGAQRRLDEHLAQQEADAWAELLRHDLDQSDASMMDSFAVHRSIHPGAAPNPLHRTIT